MGVYVVTGAGSGMGRAAAGKLEDAGHTVIGVDLRDAEVVADLATTAGRRSAAAAVLEACAGRLDGAVLAAGLGPLRGKEREIVEVNYFGVTELLRSWRPALAAGGGGKAVVLSSNATTTTPLVPRRMVRALLAGDVRRAGQALRFHGPARAVTSYGGSKLAVSHWVRREAVKPEWAGAGIRLNALAPGAILTPLLERQLADPSSARAVTSFPVPVGGFGDPGRLAEWIVFLLSDAADFMAGSVVFVDGGTDAYFRAEEWPRPVSLHGLARYLRRMRSFRRE
ncbi:NAD(P)-dependent dehydrogenase (short-subunit alcohol dehydrogenase family) [Prauserella isguenensis]|uniref:NAD(P)-dependent dehydrogenase (Short-subunit alcohol dehydrogenase family) n=1 Tax=Prauserella isguenensis TaxID=1470180 RepID=A0A839S2R8_9PSEU|nr:SDR family oxidoreductase [Prauserella isguenensis]MBB3051604.1 NAD(P)-dependent dehydrogenase (short-subunit alcohol dehydrogenase family) [Prauserella isguenensis]